MIVAIFTIIMISPDRIDAIWRMKLPQRIQIRLHFAGLVIDQIARKENHIGFFIVGRIHHLLHEIIAWRKRTEMKVGNLYQTVTIKIRWQVGRGKGNMFQF